MISWATQRKLIYVSIFFVLVIILVALPTYYVLYKPPSCTDGKQDQGEEGIDCGGPCSNVCSAAALPPTVEWSRVFEVEPGYYNAVAYVDNPNIGSAANNVSYDFQLYDANGVIIADRKGTTNIISDPSDQNLAIFEPNIVTGSKVPAQVVFTFTGTPQWYKESFTFPTLAVTGTVLNRETTSPLLQAQIEDDSFETVTDLPVVAILYDTDGNALAVSRTVVSLLEKGSPQALIFTWPAPFSKVVSEKEIIPLLGQSVITGTN